MSLGTLQKSRPGLQQAKADGQLGKERGEGEEQTEERIDIHHTCKYLNYTEESKLSESEVSRSVHSCGVGDTLGWMQKEAAEGREAQKTTRKCVRRHH